MCRWTTIAGELNANTLASQSMIWREVCKHISVFTNTTLSLYGVCKRFLCTNHSCFVTVCNPYLCCGDIYTHKRLNKRGWSNIANRKQYCPPFGTLLGSPSPYRSALSRWLVISRWQKFVKVELIVAVTLELIDLFAGKFCIFQFWYDQALKKRQSNKMVSMMWLCCTDGNTAVEISVTVSLQT